MIDLIEAALKEDMPSGDLTTDSLALGPRFGYARLIAKQDLILSGTRQFEDTMLVLDPQARLTWHFDDSAAVLNRQVVCTLAGDLIQLLKAERVALNFIGHFSGIATLTRKFVERVSHTSTKIIDTRKTLPGLRELEKKAVRHGQGFNHRFNLSEAVLIKDNHIAVAGGIATAVKRVRAHTALPIEVEASTLDDVSQAVLAEVERILLDNMSDEMMSQALKLISKGIQTEASGNMNLERVGRVSELGVDFISVGALTHSAPVADFSLLFDWQAAKQANTAI